MTYEGAILYLASLGEARIRPGLSRIRKALARLGDPHLRYPCVIVGGTNGKGSTAASIASIMGSAGHRVGLYTSPHLLRFEERIRVGTGPIGPDSMAHLVDRVRSAAADLSYFEFASAMAMLHFADAKVGLAVLEVGLGGRWDATNAAEPVVSVVTTVALDHVQWLGPTVSDIAREKAQILRHGRPAIIGNVKGEALTVLRVQAGRKGARLLLLGEEFNLAPEGDSLRYVGPKRTVDGIRLALAGHFQVSNAACALAAVEALAEAGLQAGDQAFRDGLAEVRWPGRLQVISGNPPVLLDCAHNPAAMEALVHTLAPAGAPIAWVFSSLRDKDTPGMARAMAVAGGPVFLVQMDNPRANTLAAMQAAFDEAGMAAAPQATLKSALEAARAAAGPRGRVVVAGSSYLAGSALGLLDPEAAAGRAGSLG